MKGIRVTIFDDNRGIRDSLSLLLSKTEGFDLGGAFADCNALDVAIEGTVPDVILMDIDMPGMNGIEAVKKIRENNLNLQIIMMTTFDDDTKIFDAICAGANGYLLKNNSLSEIIDSIKDVMNGGSPMSPSIARKVFKLFQKNNQPEKVSENFNLTDREKEVLKLLMEGHNYKMIADTLSVSYATVNSHIKNIYKKLHVNSMTEAVNQAHKNKLFDLF